MSLSVSREVKCFVSMVVSVFDWAIDITVFIVCFNFSKELLRDEREIVFSIFICFILCNVYSAYIYSGNSIMSKMAHLIGLGVFYEWLLLENDYTENNVIKFRRTNDLHFLCETIPCGGLYFCLGIWYIVESHEQTILEKLCRTLPCFFSLITISYSIQEHFIFETTNLRARATFGLYLIFDIIVRTFTFSLLCVFITFHHCYIYRTVASLLMFLTNYTKIIYFRKVGNNLKNVAKNTFL
jgi:hypothetical protein